MKRKMRWIAGVLLLCFALTALTACGRKNSIVGTWEYESNRKKDADCYVVFNESGSFYDPEGAMVNVVSGTWEIVADGKLHLDWGYNDEIVDFELRGGKLIIDGDWVLTRK